MKFNKKDMLQLALIVVATAVVFFALGAFCADFFEMNRLEVTEVKYVPDTAPSSTTSSATTDTVSSSTDSVEPSTTTMLTSVSTTSTATGNATTTTITNIAVSSSKVATASVTKTTNEVKSTSSATTANATTTLGKINLNTATKEELMTIKGIGEVYATRIIEYRELIGYFTSLEELLEVKGIGEKRLAQWAPYLTV